MLYMVTRTDSGSRWDEYNAVIIRAKSIQAAYELATSANAEASTPGWRVPRFAGFREDGKNLQIRRVNPKSHSDGPEVVLSSFNNG